MASSQLGGVLRHLRRTALVNDRAGLTDGELLASFVEYQDEAAFEALLRRHGPMILALCQRLLRNDADAEDAFQATFLVLVKKAPAIACPAVVASWLYGVAQNTALKARAMQSKRRTKERETQSRAVVAPTQDSPGVAEIVDEELGRLPDNFRLPVLLCSLEGKTIKEAAQQLGWPPGTVASRLARARKMLAERLARRGLVAGGGVLVLLLDPCQARAGLPARLLEGTMRTACHVAAGGKAATVASAHVLLLCEKVIRGMTLRKLRGPLSLVWLAACGLVLGLWLCQARAAPPRLGTVAAPSSQVMQGPAKQEKAKPGKLFYHLDMDIVTTDLDGEKSAALPKLSAVDRNYYQMHSARLSPDGKQLAFGRAVFKDVDGILSVTSPEKIYVRNLADQADAVLLVNMPGVAMINWCWSPDGSTLAFATMDKTNQLKNWVVDCKTKKTTEIHLPRFKSKEAHLTMSIQDWMPDGKGFLAFGDGLFLVKTDGSDPKLLVHAGTSMLEGSCRVSPDGKSVLFVTVDDGSDSQRLWVVDVPGGKAKALVDAKRLTDIHACWSPDGGKIAYSGTRLDKEGNRAGETCVFVTDAKGVKTTTVMTEMHEPQVVRLLLLGWR